MEAQTGAGAGAAPRKLLLRNFQSPGDILMLTAAVRDLHACHPGRFVTDVRTSCPDLWLNNPHLTPLAEDDPDVQVVDCHYPLIDRINTVPYHFLHGFVEYLNDTLELQIKPMQFKGDLHLSEAEMDWFKRVEDARGRVPRYWLFASGGKFDYTTKWWSPSRYQQVVEHFHGRLDFVQVGEGAITIRPSSTSSTCAGRRRCGSSPGSCITPRARSAPSAS
jgi:hypothetical protein